MRLKGCSYKGNWPAKLKYWDEILGCVQIENPLGKLDTDKMVDLLDLSLVILRLNCKVLKFQLVSYRLAYAEDLF